MKLLVGINSRFNKEDHQKIIAELSKNNIDFQTYFFMEDMGNELEILTYSSPSLYKNIKLEDIDKFNEVSLFLKTKSSHLSHEEYIDHPMHQRTVKLFRWHLDKYPEIHRENIEEILEVFSKKYEVKHGDFVNPIKIALINTTQGPDIGTIINFLGKNKIMTLFDLYFKRINQSI